MNLYFGYTINTPDTIYYGIYFDYASDRAPSDSELLTLLYPFFQVCYPLQSIQDVTLTILSSSAQAIFSERTPLRYDFVYYRSNQIYANKNKIEI